jgi:hypothetical protein
MSKVAGRRPCLYFATADGNRRMDGNSKRIVWRIEPLRMVFEQDIPL